MTILVQNTPHFSCIFIRIPSKNDVMVETRTRDYFFKKRMLRKFDVYTKAKMAKTW